jgi:hypothetical protein
LRNDRSAAALIMPVAGLPIRWREGSYSLGQGDRGTGRPTQRWSTGSKSSKRLLSFRSTPGGARMVHDLLQTQINIDARYIDQ